MLVRFLSFFFRKVTIDFLRGFPEYLTNSSIANKEDLPISGTARNFGASVFMEYASWWLPVLKWPTRIFKLGRV